jgi:hypothetical protein
MFFTRSALMDGLIISILIAPFVGGRLCPMSAWKKREGAWERM